MALILGSFVLPTRLIYNTSLVVEGQIDDLLQLFLAKIIPMGVNVAVAWKHGEKVATV